MNLCPKWTKSRVVKSKPTLLKQSKTTLYDISSRKMRHVEKFLRCGRLATNSPYLNDIVVFYKVPKPSQFANLASTK